jgi:hypothetical protein
MRIKRKFVAALATLFVSALMGHSQVTLQPGDVYIYTFTNLPQVVPGPVIDAPAGGLSVSVSSFDPATEGLLVEMFENSTSEAPLTSFTMGDVMGGTSWANAWADFQGVVRLTMVTGTATVESLTFYHDAPTGLGTTDRYQLTVVPPRTVLLEDLVPCAGPLSGGTWKNHGQYVSTVTRTARDLVRQGLMTQAERSAAVREAARSNCGKKQKEPREPRQPREPREPREPKKPKKPRH